MRPGNAIYKGSLDTIHRCIAILFTRFVSRYTWQESRYLGRDRFESTASAGRRIPSASPIDLSLAIPEDPLPSSAKGGVGPTFQNGNQNKRSSDMHRQILSYSKPKSGSYYKDPRGSLPLVVSRHLSFLIMFV